MAAKQARGTSVLEVGQLPGLPTPHIAPEKKTPLPEPMSTVESGLPPADHGPPSRPVPRECHPPFPPPSEHTGACFLSASRPKRSRGQGPWLVQLRRPPTLTGIPTHHLFPPAPLHARQRSGAENLTGNKTDKVPALLELTF